MTRTSLGIKDAYSQIKSLLRSNQRLAEAITPSVVKTSTPKKLLQNDAFMKVTMHKSLGIKDAYSQIKSLLRSNQRLAEAITPSVVKTSTPKKLLQNDSFMKVTMHKRRCRPV
jgi:hypothetical protein